MVRRRSRRPPPKARLACLASSRGALTGPPRAGDRPPGARRPRRRRPRPPGPARSRGSGRTPAGSAGGRGTPAAAPAATAAGRGCRGTRPCCSREGRLSTSRRVYGWRGSCSSPCTGPTSASRPAYITPMRSTHWAMSPMSWPTRRTAASSSFCTRKRVSMTRFCTTTSRALVGSSAMITWGRRATAMAMPTRCFMPPLSWWGYMRAVAGSSSTRASRPRTRSRRASRSGRSSWASMVSAIWAPDAHHRVEGVHHPLRDQGDAREPHPPHLLVGQGEQLQLVEVDPSPLDASRGPDQAHEGHGRGRLPRARLPHQAEALARPQLEADALHGAHRSAAGVVVDAQVLHPQQRARGPGAHEARHMRGLAMRSSPMETRKRPMKMSTISTMGGAHHHHIPRSSEV